MQRKPGLITAMIAASGFATNVTAAPGTPVDVSAADNSFGFRLLGAIQKSAPNSNIILSPVSAAIDLAMVLNGATGQTREEMLEALSLSGTDLNAVNEANARLLKILQTPPAGIDLSVADSLWVNNRQAQFRPDYLQRIQPAYDAQTAALDFSSADAARRVNEWASEQTHGRISNIIGRFDPTEVALLLSAVYFKGQWTYQFDKSRTHPDSFALPGGTLAQVPRMIESGHFDYLETADLQAIRLPFGTGDLVMEVMLPSKSSTLDALEAQLTPEHWTTWKAPHVRRSGTIELPRFELKVKYRLNEALQVLGMRRVFHAGGDAAAQLADMFAPATGQKAAGSFHISSVLQSVYWKVNEEGSEAAAVTTTGVRMAAAVRSERPFEMIVDRPFFCAIEDQRTGALLFIGAIYDPR